MRSAWHGGGKLMKPECRTPGEHRLPRGGATCHVDGRIRPRGTGDGRIRPRGTGGAVWRRDEGDGVGGRRIGGTVAIALRGARE